jgi:hypothetical protein
MPLADFFPRRQFTLILVFLAAAMWYDNARHFRSQTHVLT